MTWLLEKGRDRRKNSTGAGGPSCDDSAFVRDETRTTGSQSNSGSLLINFH